ncbi:MAG: response regulator [Candidatus Nitrosopolaris sp.]|jgi:CheY-like chemotaxis protein
MITKNQTRIPIVDDEPDVCEVLKKVLEKNGFTADSFSDPLLALENFRPLSYDLLFLDIKMPDMDGLRLYQEMKKIDSRIKVCFLTASEMYYERFRKEEEFAQLDKDLFLRKPIQNKELINEINRIMSST